MTLCVIDASVVIKWFVQEDGTPEALALRAKGLTFIAPDLLAPECANILWKNYRRNEISQGQAEAAADAIATSIDIDFIPTRSYVAGATRIAISLNHPAYDCFYLALALQRDCRFITADQRLLNKRHDENGRQFLKLVVSLTEANQ